METDDDIAQGVRALRETEPLAEAKMLAGLQQRMFGRSPERQLRFGRFVVLDLVGEGAMGRVYAAYDPELERKVALKVLRAPAEGVNQSRALARSLREAKALARLSHPNVVSVFEVGEEGGQGFIAMEFVQGENLREWMKAKPQWRETVAMLLDAGEGLAAAHRAGLIHRDFKPENVLVSGEGRVRVVDFGLARGDATVSLETTSSASGLPTESASTARAGTPAYMPPEQAAGQELDVRADQFAFCVSLYEALHGERPGVNRGAKRKPGQAWPARIDEVIRRGLEPDRADRFASMDALLARLRGASRPRRLPYYVAGLVGAGALALAFAPAGRQTACEQQAQVERSDTLLDVSSRSPQTEANGTGGAKAAAARQGAVRAAQRYAQRWRDVQSRVCDAASGRSEVAQELALACLGERRGEANAVLESGFDGATLVDVEAAMLSLPSPERCEERGRLLRRSSGALPVALATSARTTRDALAKARARIALDDPEPQLKVLAALLEEPAARADPGLRADILRLQASAFVASGEPDRARAVFVEAFAAAESGGDDRQRAEIALDVAVHVGQRLGRTDAGLDWIRVAGAVTEHLEDPSEIRVDQIVARGRVLYTAGRYEASRDAHAEAVEIMEHQGVLDPSELPSQKVRLGAAMVDAGAADAAVAVLREALDRYAELGVGGGRVALAHNNLSNALSALGEFEAGAEHARRALEWYEAVRPAVHPDIAMASNNLAIAHASSGSTLESVEHFERAAFVWEAHYGPNHPRVATAFGNLSTALYMLDRWEASLKAGDRALAAQRESLRPGHPDLAFSLRARARSLSLLERHAEAVEALEEAEGIVLAELGETHIQSASTRFDLGIALLAANRPRDALARLDLACPRLSDSDVPEIQRGDCLFANGKAAWLSGETTRGQSLLAEAATSFANAEGEWPTIRGNVVEDWMALNPRPGRPAREPEPPTH